MKRRRPFKSRLRNAFLTVSGILGIGGGGIIVEQLPKNALTDTQTLTTFNIGTPQQYGYNISPLDQMWKHTLGLKDHDALVEDLMAAAKTGDSWRVSTLLKHGGFDLQTDAGYALVEATKAGHLDVVNTFLQGGVKANVLDDAPFLAAMEVQNYKLALRFAGLANPSAANIQRAAVIATAAGSLDMLNTFIARGADITANQNEILSAAAANGHLHIIDRLLQEKTTETVQEVIPGTATWFPSITEDFTYGGFQPGCVFYPERPDEIMDLGSQWEHPPMSAPQYIDKTVETYKVNLNDNHGMPLKMAAINGEYEAFKKLMDAGADIRVAGQEILSNAVQSGNLKLVRYILKDPGITFDNLALPFQQAVDARDYGMIKSFISIGADKTIVLEQAKAKGDAELLRVLKGEKQNTKFTKTSFSPGSLL